MRALLLLPLCVLVLAGCESLLRVGSDGFEVGPGGLERFEHDADTCQSEADAPLSYDVRLIGATSYERNRTFNRVYAHCMAERGHPVRPYIRNLLPDTGAP